MNIQGKSYGVPHDRLTEITDEMLDYLEKHPKATGSEQAVVMISDPSTGMSATSLHFPEDQDESKAVMMIFRHLRAILKTHGQDLAVLGNFNTEEE